MFVNIKHVLGVDGAIEALDKYANPAGPSTAEVLDLQMGAVCLLTLLSFGTNTETEVLLTKGVEKTFVKLLKDPTSDKALVEQVGLGLGNFGRHSAAVCKWIFGEDAMTSLLFHLSRGMNVCWPIVSLLEGQDYPTDVDTINDVEVAIKLLVENSQGSSVTMETSSLEALARLSENYAAQISMHSTVQELTPILVSKADPALIDQSNPANLASVLHLIFNLFVDGMWPKEDMETFFSKNPEVFDRLLQPLKASNKDDRNVNEKQMLISFSWMLTCLAVAYKIDCAAHLFNEAKNPLAFDAWLGEGCIEPLIDMLPRVSASVAEIVLESFEDILEYGKTTSNSSHREGNPMLQYFTAGDRAGVKAITLLSKNQLDTDIADAAKDILESYFGVEDESMDDVDVLTNAIQGIHLTKP